MSAPTTTVKPKQGFHFTFQNYIPTHQFAQKSDKCAFYVLHSLPPHVFVDPYELEQRLHDNVGAPFRVWGETNLELPVSSVNEGSLVLLGPLKAEQHVELPFHARYVRPQKNATHATVVLQNPSLLKVCSQAHTEYWEQRDIKALFTPYDSPFDFETSKITFDSFTSKAKLKVRIPAGNPQHLAFVEPLTIIAILLATYYMARAIWRAASQFKPKPAIKED